MTESMATNSDTCKDLSSTIPYISQNLGEKADFSAKISKNTPPMCKNEPIIDSNFDKKLSTNVAQSDNVSSFDIENASKNQAGNFKVLSEEEDKILFSRLFPAVSRENLENDRLFKIFASGRKNDASFTSIYSDYTLLVNEIAKDLEIKGKYAQNNKSSSPGALASCEAYDDGYFTKEQVLKMSREQIARNYDKIRKSQQKW